MTSKYRKFDRDRAMTTTCGKFRTTSVERTPVDQNNDLSSLFSLDRGRAAEFKDSATRLRPAFRQAPNDFYLVLGKSRLPKKLPLFELSL